MWHGIYLRTVVHMPRDKIKFLSHSGRPSADDSVLCPSLDGILPTFAYDKITVTLLLPIIFLATYIHSTSSFSNQKFAMCCPFILTLFFTAFWARTLMNPINKNPNVQILIDGGEFCVCCCCCCSLITVN